MCPELIHIDFAELETEIQKLSESNQKLASQIIPIVKLLYQVALKVEPTIRQEYDDERALWRDYQQLQLQKLRILDASHEWEEFHLVMAKLNGRLDFLIQNAISELTDHISVLAETHRAHIDILEIWNTRRLEVIAFVVTAVISYLAVWEFFVRDLLTGIAFPGNLSPSLNYVLALLTLLPVFVTIYWAWLNRKKALFR